MRFPNWSQQRAACGLAEPDEREALRRLARWCRRYSPIVGIEDAELPECLLIDVAGCAHLFGGEMRLARCTLRDLIQIKLKPYLAVADTIGAAWALTFQAVMRKNQTPVVIAFGEQAAALNPLPVETLRVSPAIVETLHELDLRTIGQVARLPRETLPSRFSNELLLRLDQALGHVPEVIVGERPEEPIEARWAHEEAIVDRLQIEAVLGRLTDQVVAQAASRGLGISQLEIVLTQTATASLSFSIDCLRPTCHRKHLVELIRLRLERLQLKWGGCGGVVDFHVRATVALALDIAQPELFDGKQQRNGRRELDRLLNRLSNRLGRRSVLSPELREDYQPEHATAFQPVLGSRRLDPQKAQFPQRYRPVRLWPPVPVTVTSVVPDGPPIRMRWRSAEHRILHAEGPERIETGWWRGATIGRDYYRVETDQGKRYWLFRELQGNGRWFLHGEF